MLAGMRHLEEETGGSFDAQGGPTPGGAVDGGPSRGAEVVADGPAVNDPAATYVLWGVRRNQPIRP